MPIFLHSRSPRTPVRKQIKEAFALYDPEGTGRVSGSVFAQACKGLGFICGFPTQTECDEYSEMKILDEAAFCKELELRALCNKCLKEGSFFFSASGNPFAVLDKTNSGTISGEEMRKVICSLGDKMSETEYKEMFKLFGGTNPGDGPCDYKKLYAQLEAAFKEK